MDGSIRIGVDLDTDNLEKGLTKLEYEMDKRRELLNKKARIEVDFKTKDQAYEKAIDKIAELKKEYAGLTAVQHSSGAGTKLTNEILKQQKEASKLSQQAKAYQKEQKKVEDQLKKNLVVITETKNKQEESSQSVNKITQAMQKVGKSAKLWVGAIFGVRSAYLGIRKAVSLVAGQNDEIRQKIEAMSNAMANLFAPVVERIVNGLFTMMQYLDYIVQAWFGISLFSKANDKALKGAVAGAKALRKELTGFDEANVLTDSGGTSGVGATGVGDFEIPDVKIPEWVKWIAENKDSIIKGLLTIGTILAGLWAVGKVLEFTNAIGGLVGGISKLGKAFKLTGFEMGLVMGSIAVIIGVIIGITKDVIEINKLKEKANNSLRDSEDNLKTALERVKEAEENLNNARLNHLDAIEREEEATKRLEELQRKHKITGKELHDEIQNGTLKLEDMEDWQRKVYRAYLDTIKASEDVKEAQEEETEQLEKLNEQQKKEAYLADVAKIEIMRKRGEYDKVAKAIGDLEKDHGVSWENMRLKAKEVMKDMDKDEKKRFLEQLPDNVRKSLEPNKFQKAMDKLAGAFKSLWGKISGSAKIDAKVSGTMTGAVKGASSGAVTGVYGASSGAIVNLPNQGVPISHDVVAGEYGKEGIIPLTDNQMMADLGKAIGSFITLDLHNVVNMDGRTIARRVDKIKGEDNFVMNR